jgi:hypothetical protein
MGSWGNIGCCLVLLDAVADAIQITLPAGGDADGPQDVATQLDALVRQVSAMVGAHEGMFRNFLENSLNDPADMRRGSRRLDWLGAVPLPLKPSLPPADLQRLLYALSLLTGIETLVVLRDICHPPLPRRPWRKLSHWRRS